MKITKIDNFSELSIEKLPIWQTWLSPLGIARKKEFFPINKDRFLKKLMNISDQMITIHEFGPVILKLYKEVFLEGKNQLRLRLYEKKDGIEFVGTYALFIDFLIINLFKLLKNKFFSNCSPLSIIALGGYGRGELCPFSDIDLLFLINNKITSKQKQIIEFILYILWDLDLNVGNSTRTIDDNIQLAKSDFTIRTSLLEMRLVIGDKENYFTLEKNFFNWIKTQPVPEFVKKKLDERDQRINIFGGTRYAVEPNIKDGKGGLRDLHTLFWIAKYAFCFKDILKILETKILSVSEARAFSKAQRFLLTVRCFLHFHHSRENDHLTFDSQIELAPKLGFNNRSGLRDVERFMKRYFLAAKQVGNLTRVFCSALETDFTHRPFFNLKNIFFIGEGLKKEISPFIIENKRIHLPETYDFTKDINKIITLFDYTLIYQLDVHPSTIRRLIRAIRITPLNILKSTYTNNKFIKILTSKQNPERVLRLMNETGWLGKYFPDFGKILGMMQFDMYHSYTVDEHTIKAIGILSQIESGSLSHESSLASGLIHQIESRRALYLSVFLHDIAKGRKGDHSIIGATIAEKICKMLGLKEEEIETISWLIKNHLLLSKTAFRYDLNDPKTIKDFTDNVQSPERLKLLLVLTSADIRAVGPNIWNGWKSSLTRDLYKKSEPVIGGLSPTDALNEIANQRIKILKSKVNNKNKLEVENYVNSFYPSYWINFQEETILNHFLLFSSLSTKTDNLIINFRTDSKNKVTILTIIATDHPGLFSRIAGSVAITGNSILNAKINTRKDGSILDEFILQNQNQEAINDQYVLNQIKNNIENALAGDISLFNKVQEKKLNLTKRFLAMKVYPRVIISNAKSLTYTVIEVNGPDRPGLLYQITYHLAQLGLQINSASVSTYGEKVVDVFYVKDIFGHQINKKNNQDKIKNVLLSIFD